MNLEVYIRILKNYVDSRALNFGNGESVLTLLYEAYAECNKMDDGSIKENFNELYRLIRDNARGNFLWRTLGEILSTDYHGKVIICWNVVLV